jgi:hypothetical protein
LLKSGKATLPHPPPFLRKLAPVPCKIPGERPVYHLLKSGKATLFCILLKAYLGKLMTKILK